MRKTLVVTALVAIPTSAFALDQSAHQAISEDACIAAQLPNDFCERVATEAYNVDHYEWSHPEAHAQIGEGAIGTACTAANAALERERMLGADIRASLATLSRGTSKDLATHIATQLGRALHTIQDDCAHHGMPNDQHAWASLTDACTGSKTSPDLAPEATTCAKAETAAVMAAFASEVSAAGVAPSALDGISEGWTHWPDRGEVCSFLHDANKWDGTDRRWENSVVVPWLRDQLTHAITTDDTSLGDACAEGVALQIVHPNPLLDVSKKPSWCLKLDAYCIGKSDAPDEPPPWDDGSDASPEVGGCNAAGGGSGADLALLLGVLGFVVVRRRR